MTNEIFSKEELIEFNEKMLGRGVPSTEDGIGYNKADYSACSTYFYGLSDAQCADLAKRLVKYCNTQLGVERSKMENTYKEYSKNLLLSDREIGVSIEVFESESSIHFKYNKDFIDVVKRQSNRRYDKDSKTWYVSNKSLINALKDLKAVGADVDNAIEYASSRIKPSEDIATKVLAKSDGEMMLLKFDYNKLIVDEIKKIDKRNRQWNQEFKFWAVSKCSFDTLKQSLKGIAEFNLT